MQPHWMAFMCVVSPAFLVCKCPQLSRSAGRSGSPHLLATGSLPGDLEIRIKASSVQEGLRVPGYAYEGHNTWPTRCHNSWPTRGYNLYDLCLPSMPTVPCQKYSTNALRCPLAFQIPFANRFQLVLSSPCSVGARRLPITAQRAVTALVTGRHTSALARAKS